jgi:hypothetical protein
MSDDKCKPDAESHQHVFTPHPNPYTVLLQPPPAHEKTAARKRAAVWWIGQN